MLANRLALFEVEVLGSDKAGNTLVEAGEWEVDPFEVDDALSTDRDFPFALDSAGDLGVSSLP